LSSLPLVAVVILNWNGKKWLEQFLPSVLASTYGNLRIIVADNHSSDDSMAFLENTYPFIERIQLTQNWGFAKGYNEALKQIVAEYFILLNSDVEVSAGWIEPMVEILERDPGIAACQPKLLAFANKKMFEYAGAAGGWIDRFGYPFCKGRIFDVCEDDHGQYDQSEPIFWASGACLFIRSSVFKEVGGFDEYFFAHQEEIDLCWRIQLAGYTIFSCPASVVYHVGGGTLEKGNPKKTFLNFRNNHIMLNKNLPFSAKCWIVPIRICLDIASAFKSLLTGNTGYFTAVLKAHFAFCSWYLFHRNKSVFPIRKKGILNGRLNSNITWLHFIKGKKKFSEIVTRTNNR
jgi:GT2 family glycosyltransferase